jgi:exopolysaccharide biosynthesis polyprenyl glycosylphosphotransferase
MLCLIAKKLLDIRPMIVLTILQIVVGTILGFMFTKLYFALYPARNVVLICHDREAAQSIINKVKMIKERYVLRCVLPDTLDLEKMIKVIKNFESVLIYELEEGLKSKILDYCYSEGKRVYLVPTVQDLIIANCNLSQIFDTTAILCKNHGPSTEERIIKRASDILISFIGLILSSPFILLTAILVKSYDKGPVLFKQKRLTENGRIFTLYKFRSMRVNAEADGKARLASANDDRITPIGRFIRATRLDELPQLFNILKGDMSLVGPRPERPEISSEYEKQYPEFKYRLKMKAGLTGYAQVNGKYNTSPRDKLLMDLIYIQKYSILMDIKLLFKTFKIVFMPDSAEGFDKEVTDTSQIEFINEDHE